MLVEGEAIKSVSSAYLSTHDAWDEPFVIDPLVILNICKRIVRYMSGQDKLHGKFQEVSERRMITFMGSKLNISGMLEGAFR
ncbi:hypothetical protein CWE16_01955 [Synechococcus sp. BS55D]|nr:hypothetical protein CWE16_01955 [Synechococcus sp. BS55D]